MAKFPVTINSNQTVGPRNSTSSYYST